MSYLLILFLFFLSSCTNSTSVEEDELYDKEANLIQEESLPMVLFSDFLNGASKATLLYKSDTLTFTTLGENLYGEMKNLTRETICTLSLYDTAGTLLRTLTFDLYIINDYELVTLSEFDQKNPTFVTPYASLTHILKPHRVSSGDTLLLSVDGSAINSAYQDTGRWYYQQSGKAIILWGDTLEEHLSYGFDKVHYLSTYQSRYSGERKLLQVQKITPIPTIDLKTYPSSTTAISLSWECDEWTKEPTTYTLFFDTTDILDTATAFTAETADSGYLLLDTLWENRSYVMQLHAFTETGTPYAQSQIVRCTTANIAPPDFDIKRSAVTDRTVDIYLPAAPITDFKRITLCYNNSYSASTKIEFWDYAIEITDPDSTTLPLRNLMPYSSYIFQAYLEDETGLVTKSNYITLRTLSSNYDAPQMEVTVVNDSTFHFQWQRHTGRDFQEYQIRVDVDGNSVTPTKPVIWSSTDTLDTTVTLDTLFHNKNIYTFRPFVQRSDGSLSGGTPWLSDTIILHEAESQEDGVHLAWKNIKTATTYRIMRKSSGSATFSEIAKLYNFKNSWVDSSVTTGHHSYKIRAVNASSWETDPVDIYYPW